VEISEARSARLSPPGGISLATRKIQPITVHILQGGACGRPEIEAMADMVDDVIMGWVFFAAVALLKVAHG
jgi:hypothetical protein